MNHEARMRAAQSLRMYPGDTDYQVKQDGPCGLDGELLRYLSARFPYATNHSAIVDELMDIIEEHRP